MADVQSKTSSMSSLPLDELKMDILRNGQLKTVPALHIGWAEDRYFIPFERLPINHRNCLSSNDIDEVDAAVWLENSKLFEEDCYFLLKLPHHKFWSQMIYNEGTRKALDSFLQNAPRPYVLNSDRLPKEMNELYQRIHHLAFLLCLRLATYKESKLFHITPSVFGDLIYDNFLFDIPKILDLCTIYFPSNKSLLEKMVSNIFMQQPKYSSDLDKAVIELQKVAGIILERFGLAENDDMKARKLTNSKQQQQEMNTWPHLQDSFFYLVDFTVTVHNFLDVYPKGCQSFFQKGFHLQLAHLYSTAVPFLRNQFHLWNKYASETPNLLKNLFALLSFSQLCILKTFRNILYMCCIQAVDSSSALPKEVHLDNFLKNIELVLSEKSFVIEYERRYPFKDDKNIFISEGYNLDDERISYIEKSLTLIMESSMSQRYNKDTTLKHVGVAQAYNPVHPKKVAVEVENTTIECTAGAIEMSPTKLDSLVAQVIDLFPEFDLQFIKMCLEYYNYDVEELINSALEGTLPLDPKEHRNQPVCDSKKGSLSNNAEDLQLLLEENDGNDYHDEYDDTYDEQMIGIKEVTAWDDGLERKQYT